MLETLFDSVVDIHFNDAHIFVAFAMRFTCLQLYFSVFVSVGRGQCFVTVHVAL